ncbi:MAG: SURF1 family protein, partial [Aquabacterium sp.]|nr:SURF1 family protein [Aquabacterium sp.]
MLIAALLTSVVTARLGWWQLDRAAQKLDLQARIEARGSLPPLPQAQLPLDAAAAGEAHYRPVLLRGRWLADRTVALDNRQMNARQGFYIVTPLLLAPGDAVLVQRGWMPRDFTDRT